MKTKFIFNLVGKDKLEAEFEAGKDNWNAFYDNIVYLKKLYRDSVTEIINNPREVKELKDLSVGDGSDSILHKAVGATTRPVSDGQKAILRKVGYTEESFVGMTMSDASGLVKDALAVLNGKQ